MRAFVIPLLLVGTVAAGEQPDLHFEPQGLYGHINGGAELFLEFGFAGLDIYHHGADGARVGDSEHAVLAVEVYGMADHAAALGIYLAKCGDERPWPEVVARNTGSPYQLTAVKGPLFVQVNNFGGDASLRPVMADLAAAYLAEVPAAEPLAIWDALPMEDRVDGSEFLFRGRFALEPIFTFGDGDPLQLEKTGALGAGARYATAVGEEGATITRLVVVYPDATQAATALATVRANLDSYLAEERWREGRDLVFRDWKGRFGLVQRDDARLRIALHLAAAPGG